MAIFGTAMGGGTGSGGANLPTFTPPESPFVDAAALDAWSSANPNLLYNADENYSYTLVEVESNAFRWSGINKPASYNPATDSGYWILESAAALTPVQEATLLYFQYNQATDKLEASKSIETILASLFLGGQHKITSGGENTFTKNLTSQVNYSPAWEGIKDQSIPANQDSSGILPLTTRVLTDDLQFVEPDGPVGTNIVSYAGDATLANNTSLFGVRFRLGQSLSIGNIVTYSLYIGSDNAGIKVFESSQEITQAYSSGDYFDFWYGTPVEVFGGTVVYAEIVVETAQNSGVFSPLQVYATSGDPAERYTEIRIREFDDILVLTDEDLIQRQLVRSGLVTNFTASSVAGDTQVRMIPDGDTYDVFFNLDEGVTSRGFIRSRGEAFHTIPNDPAVKKFYMHINSNGTIGFGETKTPSDDLTRVHLVEFIAQNGAMEPESLIANPHLSWTDKSIQGILDTDGIRVDDSDITSPNNGTLQLQSKNFDIIGNSINYAGSKVNPHVKPIPGASPLFWTYLAQSSVGIPPIGGSNTLSPDQWDNGGVLQAVPVNQATVQRLMVINDGEFIMLFGQQLFANYDDALLNVNNVEFVLPAVLFDAVEVARIVVKQGATDTADANEVTIQNALGGGGGSGVGTQTGEFFDSDFLLKNDVDDTKRARFDCQNIPTGSQATYQFPPQEGTLALEEDRNYDLVTASKLLDKNDTLEMIDASAGDIIITMPDNPDDGERHIFWVQDNSNNIDVISNDPGAPIGNPVEVQPAKLQGQWVLSADFTDSSPNGRNLTLAGTGGAFVPASILGRSVNMFDTEGTASLAVTGWKGILGNSPRSFSAWYANNNPGVFPGAAWLIQWGSDDSGGGLWWGIRFTSGGQLDVSIKNAGRQYNSTNPAIVSLLDGNPHHIAVTQSGANANTIILYIDGVAVSHNTQDTSPTMNTKSEFDAHIGRGMISSININDCKLYDVRLWNAALSALEVDTVRTENIGGGLNISAADNNTVIEFAYNGTEWIADTAVLLRVLDLYQGLAGLAEVARTGSYNDLIDLPPDISGIYNGGVSPTAGTWYRIASTGAAEAPEINVIVNLTALYGVFKHDCIFSITHSQTDEWKEPVFNLISNRPVDSASIQAVRLVSDDIAGELTPHHIEVLVVNNGTTSDMSFNIVSQIPYSNLTPNNPFATASIPVSPAREIKSWEVGGLKHNLSDALFVTGNNLIEYGPVQKGIPRVTQNNVPFAAYTNQQDGTQLTRSANAPEAIGTTLTNANFDGSGLIQWKFFGAGNGSVIKEVNTTIDGNVIIDPDQVGENAHVFRLVKDGWYKGYLQINLDDGNDGLNYEAKLMRIDNTDTIVEILAIIEHADLGRQCVTLMWEGFYSSGDGFVFLKTGGSGINDDLVGRNPRFELKWMGVV